MQGKFKGDEKMKILSHQEILQLCVKPEVCYNWVVEVIRGKKSTILPAKISMKPTEGIFYNVMPSIIPQHNTAGLKVITRYPMRKPALDSQIMLFDYSTGKIKALLDGNFITTMRTGAVAVLSIVLFAKENFEKIGLIGLGNQARAAIKIFLSLYPKKIIKLRILKYKDQHELFKAYLRGLTGPDRFVVELSDSYKDVINGSDIIISSATYFPENICEDRWFSEGCLVIPIHTRGFMNCDLFFDKVFADDAKHVKDFKHFDRFKRFAEVSDVINNVTEGRENDSERIIVYNIGLSIFDLYFAEKIYQLAELKDVGRQINLTPPIEKFWV